MLLKPQYLLTMFTKRPPALPGSMFFQFFGNPATTPALGADEAGRLRIRATAATTREAVLEMSKDQSGDTGAKPVDARVARRRQDALGRRLRQMYDEVVSEHVPADFLSLLEQADGPKSSDKDDDLDAVDASVSGANGSKK